MQSFTEDTAAQAVLDGLQNNTDIAEPLGHLCRFMVENKKKAVAFKWRQDKKFVSELQLDYDRTLSYLWERAAPMLQKTRPTNSKHLYSLMSRLLYFSHSDAYRVEDREKQGNSHCSRHGGGRDSIQLVAGSTPVVHRHDNGSSRQIQLLQIIPDLDADCSTRCLESKEELTYLVETAALLHDGTLKKKYSNRRSTAQTFKTLVFGLLEGFSLAELAERIRLHPSRISQLYSALCYQMAVVVKQRYPQNNSRIPLPTLAHFISKAINQSRPRHDDGKPKAGVRHVLSHREKKEN